MGKVLHYVLRIDPTMVVCTALFCATLYAVVSMVTGAVANRPPQHALDIKLTVNNSERKPVIEAYQLGPDRKLKKID